MECKNGDDSMGACVASCAADGGDGGFAWKTENDLLSFACRFYFAHINNMTLYR